MTSEEIQEIKQLSNKYRDELYHFCLRRVNYNADIAENCLQDTYLTLEEILHDRKYDIMNCHSWLYTVLNNNIKKHMNEKNKQDFYEHKFSELKKAETENLINLVDPSASVAEEIESRETKRIILAKAAALKEEEKSLFIDYYLNDATLVSIAKNENKSVNSIKKRNQRLKKKLREMFKDMKEEEVL